jgi:hypothetical protein
MLKLTAIGNAETIGRGLFYKTSGIKNPESNREQFLVNFKNLE